MRFFLLQIPVLTMDIETILFLRDGTVACVTTVNTVTTLRAKDTAPGLQLTSVVINYLVNIALRDRRLGYRLG